MSETQTLYKLIILYILNHVAFPLSNAQLSGWMRAESVSSKRDCWRVK